MGRMLLRKVKKNSNGLPIKYTVTTFWFLVVLNIKDVGGLKL